MKSHVYTLVTGGVVFLYGVIVGATAGVLMAPASGARTRRHLKTMAEDWREEIGDVAADARSKIDQVIERGKHIVT